MIRVEIDKKSIEKIESVLKGMDPRDQSKTIFKGFRKSALLIERRLKDNVGGIMLKVRTARLSTSIGSRVDISEKGITATIGSAARQGRRVPYANIHEKGGTIRPSIRSWLTIPLDAAKTEAGATRFTAQQVRDGHTKYRASFIRKGIIFGVEARGGGIVPLFVLKKSVQIPASRYLSRTAAQVADDVNGEMVIAVKEAATPKE